jgi:enoyl-CoA hydratase/carnithine racemase
MSDESNAVHTIQFTGSGVFNPEVLDATHKALDAVEGDPSIQAVFLRGEGKNFSQGLDLEYLMANPDIFSEFVTSTMHLAARFLTFPVPVVSLVNGHAFGLGAMLVLASDYAVMRGDRGFFCLPEIDIGMTLTVRMNALVKASMSAYAIRETLLTGGRLTGEQARSMGVVDAVGDDSELEALALQVSAPMRGKPRELLAALKYGVHQELVDLMMSDAPDDAYKQVKIWPR